jgi:hypothetical protein
LTINLGNTLGRPENMWGTLLEGRKTCGEHSWKVGKRAGSMWGSAREWATLTIGKRVSNINKVDKKVFTIISVVSVSNL